LPPPQDEDPRAEALRRDQLFEARHLVPTERRNIDGHEAGPVATPLDLKRELRPLGVEGPGRELPTAS